MYRTSSPSTTGRVLASACLAFATSVLSIANISTALAQEQSVASQSAGGPAAGASTAGASNAGGPAAEAETNPAAAPTSANKKQIEFSFEKADWKDVIPWFAEQAGYSWQPISQWPEGTFTLVDNQKYTPMEALDQINYALRLRQPPYTIIRNRNQLILTEAASPLPDELLETITPEQLDQRGDYELVRCIFRLGSLRVDQVENDLRQEIAPAYQEFIRVLPVANEFHARDTGANLRKVRDTIVAMTARDATTYDNYALQHYDGEQFLIVARPLLGIAPESYQREDQSLVIVSDPSSNRFILKGTSEAIADFRNVAKVIDVAADEEDVSLERPFLKSYAVYTDPEIARKVVETMLDGTDATVGQDEVTGAIVLRARKDQHKVVEDTIATLRGESGTTQIIQLQNSSASTILSAVQTLLSQTTLTGDANTGPKLLANTIQNYIVIRGTPSEIFEVTQMIEKLDAAQELDPDRVRTNARVIKMAPNKRDELLDSVEDIWPSTGRENHLRIIMPEDRDQLRSRNRSGFRRFDEASDNDSSFNDSSFNHRGANDRSAKIDPSHSSTRWSQRLFSLAPMFLPTAMLTVPDEPADIEQSERPGNSDDGDSVDRSTYSPPKEFKSIRGADISVKGTAFGILIESDDLDALDDLETILMQDAADEGLDQGLTIFYLKYKGAASIKSALDTMFGLGSSSSGGGGGGLMGGIMDNMAGGGTGDLLGGLLGGGMSSSGGIMLTGDVTIGMYVPLNLIYVNGATQGDLEIISDAIETFDQPSAPQDPELNGQIYAIPVRYRDAEEVLNLVRSLMSEYIVSESSEEEKKDDGNGAEQMAKMVRRMAGGGGGGEESNAGAEQDKPTIRVDLDPETDQILLTGPEFIYKQVRTLVELIDRPEIASPRTSSVLPSNQFSPAALRVLQQMYGEKLTVVAETDEEEAAAGDDANRRGKDGDDAAKKQQQAQQKAQQQQQQQRAAAFMRSIQQRAQGGGGGGNRGGGGGGGNRGGGGGNRGGRN